MNIHLLIHNIGFAVSGVVGIGVAYFIFFNNKRSIANIMMTLTTLALVVFIISHIIGVNVSDPIISRNILMFNLSIYFTGMFAVHSILAYLGKARSRWYIITLIYIAGAAIVTLLLIHPDLFLLPSVPKMYFPNYYEAGILNWTRIAFLYVVCLSYISIEIAYAFNKENDSRIRNQYKYLLIAIIGTATVGFFPNFLVYDMPVDPLWGTAFLIIFATLIIYGSLKYELLNIRVVAKQAFIYTVGIIVVGGFIMIFDYTNKVIQNVYPNFPFWIAPFISSIFIIAIAASVWRRLRENEVLKYEFITTVTHKFRTPLTHIKWASENLAQTVTALDERVQLNYIQSANEKLVELTGLLMNISEAENSDYEYKVGRRSLSSLVTEVADSLVEQYAIKKLRVTRNIDEGIEANFDESRIRFIVQTFIENAIHYTPEAGTITISLKTIGHDATFSVTDSGIGIAPEELSRLFTKFYRGHKARITDTEGMGIGLYMSKEIIAHHHGKIWAESRGQDKGSTFSFSLKKLS